MTSKYETKKKKKFINKCRTSFIENSMFIIDTSIAIVRL